MGRLSFPVQPVAVVVTAATLQTPARIPRTAVQAALQAALQQPPEVAVRRASRTLPQARMEQTATAPSVELEAAVVEETTQELASREVRAGNRAAVAAGAAAAPQSEVLAVPVGLALLS